MSIINTNNEQSDPTIEQKQQQVARRIQNQASSLFKQMGGTYQNIKRLVWDNPQGLTPQQVFDALGESGAELFQLSALLVNTVNTAKPGTLNASQPYEFTINDDGTVTVGDPVVPEPTTTLTPEPTPTPEPSENPEPTTTTEP